MFFVALSIATVTRQIEFSHFDVTVRLQFQESCDNFGQLRRIVVMHHVAGVIDGHATVIPYGIIALLFVCSPRLPALLAVDNKHRTLAPPNTLPSLQRATCS